MKTVKIKKPQETNCFEIENGDQLKDLINDGEYPFLLFESGALYPIVEIESNGVYVRCFNCGSGKFYNVYYQSNCLYQKIIILSHKELGELAKI